jgi:hypothetical protein
MQVSCIVSMHELSSVISRPPGARSQTHRITPRTLKTGPAGTVGGPGEGGQPGAGLVAVQARNSGRGGHAAAAGPVAREAGDDGRRCAGPGGDGAFGMPWGMPGQDEMRDQAGDVDPGGARYGLNPVGQPDPAAGASLRA